MAVRKASATADGKEAALLPNEHGGGDHGRGSKHHEPGDPPLDELFQPPQQQGDSDEGSSLDERDMPALSLLNTPMGMSGDVLRRTFSGVRVDSPSSRRGHSRSGSHGGGAWVAEDVESQHSKQKISLMYHALCPCASAKNGANFFTCTNS